DGRLMRFKITAGPNGPVGISDVGLRITASGATVSGVSVYVFSDPSYSTSVTIPGGGNGTGSVGYNENGGTRYDIGFTNGPLEIPMGGTYYFEARGNVQISAS